MRAAASLGPWPRRSQTDVSVAAVLPNVSFCIRTNLKWSDGVGHFGSRLFWKGGSPPFLSPDLNGFSTAIATAWQNNLAQDVQNLFSLVEVDSLDAVGQALDRVNAEGFQLSSTLGRHTNDKMVSFYVRAPGDWDIEFGTDGMRVDETYYTAEEITADSYWGHQWVGDLPAAMRL